jgi:hypothetical protein
MSSLIIDLRRAQSAKEEAVRLRVTRDGDRLVKVCQVFLPFDYVGRTIDLRSSATGVTGFRDHADRVISDIVADEVISVYLDRDELVRRQVDGSMLATNGAGDAAAITVILDRRADPSDGSFESTRLCTINIFLVLTASFPAAPIRSFAAQSDAETKYVGDYAILGCLTVTLDPLYVYDHGIELSLQPRDGEVLSLIPHLSETPGSYSATDLAGMIELKLPFSAAEIKRSEGKLSVDVAILASRLPTAPAAAAVTIDLSWSGNNELDAHPLPPDAELDVPIPTFRDKFHIVFGDRSYRAVSPECSFKDVVLRLDGQDLVCRGGPSHLRLSYTGEEELTDVSADCQVTFKQGRPVNLSNVDVRVKENRMTIPLSDLSISTAKKEQVTGLNFSGTLSFTHRLSSWQVAWGVAIICEVDLSAPKFLICVDFGTSATAVGIAEQPRGVPGGTPKFAPLPLGAWLEVVDKWHDESKAIVGATAGMLIPSHIGLSRQRNHRSNFDAISLGDLGCVGGTSGAVEKRLALLGLKYDVSIPATFLDEPAAVSDGLDEPPVAFERDAYWSLKTAMLRRSDAQTLRGRVSERRNEKVADTEDVNIDDLLSDYFLELGRYVLPRVAEFVTENRPSRDKGKSPPIGGGSDFSAQTINLAKALLQAPIEEVGVVLTHPSGLSAVRLSAYRKAGRALLAGFTGMALESDKKKAALDGRVFLVSEALAATRTHMSQQLAKTEIAALIDIGAGTFDVAIIGPPRENQPNWTVHSDFSVRAAGNMLDRQIACLVDAVLAVACSDPAARDLVERPARLPSRILDVYDLPSNGERNRGIEFLRALKTAKVELAAAASGPPYQWRDKESFRVALGAVGRSTAVLSLRNKATTFKPVQVLGGLATLSLERIVRPGSPQNVDDMFVLSMARALFDGGALELGDTAVLDAARRYNMVLNLLGESLPKVVGEEVKRLKGRESMARIFVVGRTSLWPPLFERIAASLSDLDDRIAPKMPADMKLAVVSGAASLVFDDQHRHKRNTRIRAALVRRDFTGQETFIRLQYGTPLDIATDAGKAWLVDALPGMGGQSDLLQEFAEIRRNIEQNEEDGVTPYVVLEDLSAVNRKVTLELFEEDNITRCELSDTGGSGGSFFSAKLPALCEVTET